MLTFECTTVGLDQTLWNGTAFNCENRGNQIILLNSAFSSGGLGSRGTCGDNLVAQGTKVDGNCYTSQLNITVTSSGLNQTSIECVYSSEKVNTVGRTVLTLLLSKEPSYMMRVLWHKKTLIVTYNTPNSNALDVYNNGVYTRLIENLKPVINGVTTKILNAFNSHHR
ncbi:MAG: hypothetical protein MJE68_08285 [Proteobacteria bacterium]|nr:hypothetical protein [Pseudomonadota bacterium]